MIGKHAVHGHAIVSADHAIAAADGAMPPGLANAADQARFQAALDDATVVVLGRRSHEAAANRRDRNRLVVSGSARGVERRADAWWWNPADVPPTAALAKVAPAGGIAAVVGGTRVYDLFLACGFDRFDLVRVGGLALPGGVPIFSAVAAGSSPEEVLRAHGLAAADRTFLDRAAGVTLTVWRPSPAAA
jgi:hypothetical protein